MDRLFMEDIKDMGRNTLTDICNYVGLDYPTQTMLEMMKTRNDKISEILEGHTDVYDRALMKKVSDLAEQWNLQILQEGQKAALCKSDTSAREDCAVVLGTAPINVDEPNPGNSESQSPNTPQAQPETQASGGNSGGSSDDGSSLLPIIVGCSVGVVLCIGIATSVVVVKGRGGKTAQNYGSGNAPTTETDDVVVGRPVEGDVPTQDSSGGVVAPPPAPDKDRM